MATLESIGVIGRKMMLAAALLGTLVLGACGGSTGPEENPWQDVSSFSWPQNSSTTMKYLEKAYTNGEIDTVKERTVFTKQAVWQGQTMFTLAEDKPVPAPIYYLSTRDTLTVRNATFGGEYPLVTPIEKGKSWISGYKSNQPKWKATIVETLSLLRLNGISYRNVVGVKYELINLVKGTERPQICYRYYAEGIGPVRELNSYYNENANVSIASPETTLQQELTSTSQN